MLATSRCHRNYRSVIGDLRIGIGSGGCKSSGSRRNVGRCSNRSLPCRSCSESRSTADLVWLWPRTDSGGADSKNEKLSGSPSDQSYMVTDVSRLNEQAIWWQAGAV